METTINRNQLLILGLLYTIHNLEKKLGFTSPIRNRLSDAEMKITLLEIFKPFELKEVNRSELTRLETSGYLQLNYASQWDLTSHIFPYEFKEVEDNDIGFYKTPLGRKIWTDWKNELQFAKLTPAGIAALQK